MANSKIVWGVSLTPIFVLFLLFSPFWLFAGVVFTAIAIGLWEFKSMVMPDFSHAAAAPFLIAGVAVIASSYWCNPSIILAAVAFAFLFLLMWYLFFESNLEKAVVSLSKTGLGLLYVSLLGSFIILLKDCQIATGANWIVLLFFAIWANDAGAFFVGRKFGKHKLFERISPKKTIEGSIGGLIAGILAVPVWKIVFSADIVSWRDTLIIGLVMGVMGPIGDLVESMLKRASNVKDSGNLIPGHGGILDRVDSIIFAAPFLYFFVLIRYMPL